MRVTRPRRPETPATRGETLPWVDPAPATDPAPAIDPPPAIDTGALLAELLHRSHLLTPDDFAETVADVARHLSARDTLIYLLDYAKVLLVPLSPPAGTPPAAVAVDSSMGGRALRHYSPMRSTTDDGQQLWIPIVTGTQRLGVMRYTFPAYTPVDDEMQEAYTAFTTLVGELLLNKSKYGDIMERTRRTKPMSLAAEIQWRMLPPVTFATNHLVICAMLEPWEKVGGDGFDYALNGDVAHLAVFDAMGHGIDAALLASVALGAYRQARLEDRSLREIYSEVDAALKTHISNDRFVTALLAKLTLSNGRLRWLSAGHPAPLLIRGGKLINHLKLPACPPLGLWFTGAPIIIGEETLEPADRLLLYTDGVVEARTPDGEFFTVERLGDFLIRESASGVPAPEALRRLSHSILTHQRGHLQDDATTLLVEWTGGSERTLLV